MFHLLNFSYLGSFSGITEFLKFTTGGSTPPPTDIFQIVVEVSSEASAIFASTCLRKLVLPESLAEEDDNEFRLCLNSVMDGKGNAFSAPWKKRNSKSQCYACQRFSKSIRREIVILWVPRFLKRTHHIWRFPKTFRINTKQQQNKSETQPRPQCFSLQKFVESTVF